VVSYQIFNFRQASCLCVYLFDCEYPTSNKWKPIKFNAQLWQTKFSYKCMYDVGWLAIGKAIIIIYVVLFEKICKRYMYVWRSGFYINAHILIDSIKTKKNATQNATITSTIHIYIYIYNTVCSIPCSCSVEASSIKFSACLSRNLLI